MAIRVKEVMNGEVFTVGPHEPYDRVRESLLAMGITAAPVIGDDGRTVGMISLRDLVAENKGASVGDRMSRPAVTVRADDPIAHAARMLAETGFHHLPVVDAGGRAIGFVSALDLLCGLVGLPAPHPAPFPHLDPRTGLTWTDERPLSFAHLEVAPDGPGVLVLIHGQAHLPDRVVWAEAPRNVRARLLDILSTPQEPALARWLERGNIRFRAAESHDASARTRAVALALADTVPLPQ